jgi:hypothetical protein
MAQQGSSELRTKTDDSRLDVQTFVRRRFFSAMDAIGKEREATRDAVRTDLAARGFGFALDPLDPRFDQAEIGYCKSVLRAKADALFEAYEVYGLAPDDWIWNELNSHQQQLLVARRNSLKQEATGRAVRTGRNSAPSLARAEALGREIERSTHAFLKSLACEIEKRKHMRKTETLRPLVQNTFYGPVGNVAQNSEHFNQTARLGIQPQDISRLVTEFTAHLDELNLDTRQKQRAEIQIATLRAELHGDPDPVIVTQAGRTLRNITEGAIGSLLATAAANPLVWQWIYQRLTSF